MQSLSVNGYTRQEIIDVLHYKKGNREIKFRYELLDKNEEFKSHLTNVEGGQIEMSAFSTIKRTAKFKIKDTGGIDWLNDRIRPYARLKMPDGNYAGG